MNSHIKQESVQALERLAQCNVSRPVNISLSSSGSESSSEGSDIDEFDDVGLNPKKKQRTAAVLPDGFLDPILPLETTVSHNALVTVKPENNFHNSMAVNNWKQKAVTTVALVPTSRQFWKAGDYEGCSDAGKLYDDEMDHVRVHPKFLHSNATSHKWALGAFAELLDNALDETCNGATYVSVDVLQNNKDETKMVVVQDDGGGMTPDKMRQCMSLGYSAKSKFANTIGQYGNGFKTSTMRLGADVIVFSRCEGKYGGRATQSIGLLSYTFLRRTGKEDIVVPMIDYESRGNYWSKYVKSSSDSWHRNLETIVQWSPYESEEDLLEQFNFLGEKGTRVIIYNLWEDDEGSAELDFDTDQHDIQIRGDDRDEGKIKMAKTYSSSTHFLTYRHSLRSYASILYRRLPADFRIILRGKEVDHHDLVNDMIHKEKLSYKPAVHADTKDPNMSATVILGFVKDAKHHIDIQGFNVYHKNRLIKPFWRVWNAAGSDGRGVIGVLEANFIEPAHDKQGFERTVALSRLENRLVYFQKNYWSSNCHLIGYAQRRGAKKSAPFDKNASCNIEVEPKPIRSTQGTVESTTERHDSQEKDTTSCQNKFQTETKAADILQVKAEGSGRDEAVPPSVSRNQNVIINISLKLKQENQTLKDSLRVVLEDLQQEKDQKESLQNELQHMKTVVATMDKEQEMFVTAFAEERGRRDAAEEALRRRLKDASETIQALLKKVKTLEGARK